MSKGTYIFICDIAGYISGAPIYYRNKSICLAEDDWKVYVFANKRGEIYVNGIEPFVAGYFSFLNSRPGLYTSAQRSKLVERMIYSMGSDLAQPVFVETGTDWTAYWGELLAQRLVARHFVFFLDESNDRIDDCLDFFEFKRERQELACISKQTMIELFKGYKDIALDEAVSWSACCTNSVQDIENDFSRSLIRSDVNVGSVGRLEKVFVPQIVDGVKQYAKDNRNLTITMAFFGGAPSGVEEGIVSSIQDCPNVRLFVSGYMWPLPLSALRKMDMFFSAAGSVRLTASLGIPSVAMDVFGNGIVGFVDSLAYKLDPLHISSQMLGEQKSVQEYIDIVMRGGAPSYACTFDQDNQWKHFCDVYLSQIAAVQAIETPLAYFDVAQLPLTKKQKLKKLLYRIAGQEIGEAFVRMIKRLVCRKTHYARS